MHYYIWLILINLILIQRCSLMWITVYNRPLYSQVILNFSFLNINITLVPGKWLLPIKMSSLLESHGILKWFSIKPLSFQSLGNKPTQGLAQPYEFCHHSGLTGDDGDIMLAKNKRVKLIFPKKGEKTNNKRTGQCAPSDEVSGELQGFLRNSHLKSGNTFPCLALIFFVQ